MTLQDKMKRYNTKNDDIGTWLDLLTKNNSFTLINYLSNSKFMSLSFNILLVLFAIFALIFTKLSQTKYVLNLSNFFK